MRNQNKILLAGGNLRQFESMLSAFWESGFELIFAADVQEGFRLAQRERPNLIISEFDLPGGARADLCRMIRKDAELWSTAFVFFSEKLQESENVNEAFCAGADDCFAGFFTPQFLAAKAVWLIERKSMDEALNQHYQVLRQNQSQILDIIKQTSKLIDHKNLSRKIEKPDEMPLQANEKFISHRLDLGLGLIGALANLVEDQMRALDLRESSLRGELVGSLEMPNESETLCFYEISCN